MKLDTRTANCLLHLMHEPGRRLPSLPRTPEEERDLLLRAWTAGVLDSTRLLNTPNFGRKSLQLLIEACQYYGMAPPAPAATRDEFKTLERLLAKPALREHARKLLGD